MLHGSPPTCASYSAIDIAIICDNHSTQVGSSASVSKFQVLDIQPSTRYAGGNLLATKLRRVEAAWLTKGWETKLIALEIVLALPP